MLATTHMEKYCELPLQAIAELLGVPQQDRRKIFDWSNQMVGSDDPKCANLGPAGDRADVQRDADAMPDISKAGEPERLRSGWLNGIKRLPVDYR